MSKAINLNKYTLLEKGNSDKIYFYPASAITRQVVTKKLKEPSVMFEITKDKNTCSMCCSMLDSTELIFNTYTILVKEISENKYVVIEDKKDIEHAEILPTNVIDFYDLDYKNLIKFLKDNEEFSKILPHLEKSLKQGVQHLQEEQDRVKNTNTPDRQKYVQNVASFYMNRLIDSIPLEANSEITKIIYGQLYKNYHDSFYDKAQIDLSLIILYAIVLNKHKTTKLRPHDILNPELLKIYFIDEKITTKKLNKFIDTIASEENVSENLSGLNKTLKETINSTNSSNFLKIISLDKGETISEETLKSTLINSIINHMYYPLQYNQILIYNENNNNIDTIIIITNDLLFELLKSYKLIINSDNQNILELTKNIESLIRDNNKNDIKYIPLYIMGLVSVYSYYNYNFQNILLFNKGEYILKLDFKKGNYDIKIIERNNIAKYGNFKKLNIQTKAQIQDSLNNEEKAFNVLMNELVFSNLYNSLTSLKIKITIKELLMNNIYISFDNDLTKDILKLSVPLDVLLVIFSDIKLINKVKEVKDDDEEKEKIKMKYDIPADEYEYTIRKADVIYKLMNKKKLNNPTYIEITSLYGKLRSLKETDKNYRTMKKELIKKLYELVNEK